MASPLTPVSISIILQYISPPSEITQDLPPHLLSQSLLQRHHFLDIHPADDPISYISWPSSDQQQAYSLLEAHSPANKNLSDSQFHIRYIADHESLFAHAELGSSGVRLVFHWDNRDDSWKYHNLALMPFPSSSYESPSTAQKSLPLTNGSHSHETGTDEDAYWESYGQDDGYKSDTGRQVSQTDTQGEDAYWAQYASVQGTADSTIPSPLIDTKRKALPSDDHHGEDWDAHMSQNHSDAYPNHWQDSAPSHSEHTTAEKVLDIPPSSLIIKPSNQYNPHSPPSPRDLSDRLSALSSNEDREAVFERHLNGTGKTSDFAVKESIRGIYQLWKFSSSSGISNGDEEKERFLQLIREALE